MTITLTIEGQGRSRSMSQVGLAMLLGLPPEEVAGRIAWFLGLDPVSSPVPAPLPQPVHIENIPGEGGKGGMGNVSENVTRNVDVENIITNVPNITLERGLERDTIPMPATRSLAERLAEELADPSSLRCYRQLVEAHPHARLERALALTLAVPPERLTKTRGAYFMGIVRMLAKQEAATA